MKKYENFRRIMKKKVAGSRLDSRYLLNQEPRGYHQLDSPPLIKINRNINSLFSCYRIIKSFINTGHNTISTILSIWIWIIEVKLETNLHILMSWSNSCKLSLINMSSIENFWDIKSSMMSLINKVFSCI